MKQLTKKQDAESEHRPGPRPVPALYRFFQNRYNTGTRPTLADSGTRTRHVAAHHHKDVASTEAWDRKGFFSSVPPTAPPHGGVALICETPACIFARIAFSSAALLLASSTLRNARQHL